MMDWMGLSAEEWTAVRLSLKVATVATIVALPFGIAIALALARGRFWGKSLLNGVVHLPLVMPPVVTGYLLLLVFGRRGPIGSFLADALRHRLLVPLDRRGAGLRRHGLSADGARHPPVASRRSTARLEAGGRHARRQPRLGVPHGHPAADRARHHRRADPVLRQGHRRVRRHHHLRLQHPRRDADAALGHLHLHPGAGRRRRRAAADRRSRSPSRLPRCSPPSCWRAGRIAIWSWR